MGEAAIHLGSYLKPIRGLEGLHFCATLRGGGKLLATLESILERPDFGSRQVHLEPIPDKALGRVASRHSGVVHRDELLITPAEATELQDFDDAAELRATREDLAMFIKAVQASGRGIGDFTLFDGAMWVWWGYSFVEGKLCTPKPDFGDTAPFDEP